MKHFKHFIAVLLAVALLSADGRKPYDKALASSVQIHAGEHTGMGVFVGDNLILTAAHVLHGEPGIWANRPGGADMLCTLVASEPTKDLALLRVDGAGRPMRLAAASACPGEPLFIITGGEHPFGYSGGTARQVYTTKASFPETELNVRALEMGCTLNMGDSGSMIVDVNGNLVGICSYFDLFRNESYIGIDVSEIRAFIERRHSP